MGTPFAEAFCRFARGNAGCTPDPVEPLREVKIHGGSEALVAHESTRPGGTMPRLQVGMVHRVTSTLDADHHVVVRQPLARVISTDLAEVNFRPGMHGDSLPAPEPLTRDRGARLATVTAVVVVLDGHAGNFAQPPSER